MSFLCHLFLFLTLAFFTLFLSRVCKSTLIRKYCHKSHAIYLSFFGCKFTPTSLPRYFPKAEFPRETFQLISIFCFLEVRTVFRRWKERTRKHSPDNQVFRLNMDRSNDKKLFLFLETWLGPTAFPFQYRKHGKKGVNITG